MTRFARARGSKASNQRVPEDATPWSLLKQKITDRTDDSSERNNKETNWKDAINNDKKVENKVQSVWCEFTEDDVNIKESSKKEKNKRKFESEDMVVDKSSKIKKRKINVNISQDGIQTILETGSNVKEKSSKTGKHKSKVECENVTADKKQEKNANNASEYEDVAADKSNQVNKQKKNACSVFEYEDMATDKSNKVKKQKKNANIISEYEDVDADKSNKVKKQKKNANIIFEDVDADKSNKVKTQETNVNNVSEYDDVAVNKNKVKKQKKNVNNVSNNVQHNNDNYFKSEFEESKEHDARPDFNKHHNQRNQFNSHRDHRSITEEEFRKSAFRSEPYKRRKLDQGNKTLAMNGQDIVLTKLDGFYIRKEDADRIRRLEKELIRKSVPKEEILAAIRRERRNAEKSLAREKKKVCFHCRNGGHNLSSCPKLTGAMGSGICYKCGSTEHSHLECKVSSGYKFAVCFICQEEGHISRECPDNPRGLYPQGGGCNICGDVTHYRKDCPRQQSKGKVTADIFQDDFEEHPEDNSAILSNPSSDKKRKNKIIKFN